eukprot:GHVP01009336.1.p1 GENE.GHVP01009336.1~~GHVP01009336.1.p1  ORF type:complete len:314 (+),score=117.84 GHVP01009336.1:36-977(+)
MSTKKRFRELKVLLENTKKSKQSEEIIIVESNEKKLPQGFRDEDEELAVEVAQSPLPEKSENKFESVIFSEGFNLKDEFVIEDEKIEDLDFEEQESPEELLALVGSEPMDGWEERNKAEALNEEIDEIVDVDEDEDEEVLNLKILAEEEIKNEPKTIHRLDETVQQSAEQKRAAEAEEIEEDMNGIPIGFFDDQKIEAQKKRGDIAIEEKKKRDLDDQMKVLQKAIQVDEDLMKKKLLDEDVARTEESYVDDIRSKVEALNRLNQIQVKAKNRIIHVVDDVDDMKDVSDSSLSEDDGDVSFDIDWQSRKNIKK